MRKLIKVERLIEDAEAQGLDPDQLYVDPDDVVELEKDEEGD